MFIVDSHCHLNFPDFSEDIAEVIANAGDAHVRLMQTICTKMSEFHDVVKIADSHDNIYCSVGVHPHESGKSALVEKADLLEKTKLPKVIGVGETGLDYYYEYSDRVAQKASFIRHIEVARETGLPIIIHTRSADEDTISILRQEMEKGEFRGLIHCFSTSKALAEAAIGLGLYISISGIITFKKSDELREIVGDLPIEKLLVETDAPYLAPMPHRGKRNEPAYTYEVCAKLAEIKNISVEECAKITTNNFFDLFNKVNKAHYIS